MDHANDPLIGTWILDQFQLVAVIGWGGTGRVYLANQVPMDRRVAIKVLGIGDPEMRLRFRNEARTISRLVHPNVITVYNFGELGDGQLFLAMEYVEGQTLRTRLEQGALPLVQAVQIAYQCAGALECAHRAKIIHRDLKPENVMLARVQGRDHVKVLDFGVARRADDEKDITPVGLVIGTPQYMSPEQCRGDVVTASSDQYALGTILYEMVVGRPAFVSDSLVGYLLLHQQKPVPPLASQRDEFGVAQLDPIVQRMTQHEPTARFPTMAEVQAALDPLRKQLSGAKPVRRTGELAVATATKQPKSRAVVIGKGPPFRADSLESVLDWGFEIVGHVANLKGRDAPRDGSVSVVRTSTDWEATADKLQGPGIRLDRTLFAIDAPIDSADAIRSIGRLGNVVIGRPVDATAIGVALRGMHQRDTALIEAIATRSVQLIQVTASQMKSHYIDSMLDDLTAENIPEPAKRAVKAAAEEMILNAIFHAPVSPSGARPYAHLERRTPVNLGDKEHAYLRWAIGDHYIAVSIRDRFGSLTPHRITTALGPQVLVDPTADVVSAGMGLSIIARAARHLFIALVPGESCEVLVLIEQERSRDAFERRSLAVLQGSTGTERQLGDRLWIRETQHDHVVHIEMRGEINETSDLVPVFHRTGEVWIDFADVTAINSSGVLAWMKALRGRTEPPHVLFERCSPAVVNQFGMIRDLAKSGEIVSVQLPYACRECEKEITTVLEVAGAARRATEIPEARCPDCGHALEFAEIPELYLAVLRL